MVSDVTGGAIGAALVRLTPIVGVLAPRHDRGFAAMTDDAGHYQLRVPYGRYRVTCSHEAYVPSARVIEIRHSARRVDFALAPGGVIEGIVRSTATGKPVSNAQVRFARESARAMPGLGSIAELRSGGTVSTDANGRFRLRGLAAGTIKLRAIATGSASRAPTTVPLGIAERVTGIELFVVDGYAIRGTVTVKATGEPAAGVWVSAHARGGLTLSAPAKTGGDGRFVIDGALPDRYTLRVHSTAFVTGMIGTPVEVKNADVTGVKLHVVAGAMIRGRVEPATAAEVGIKIAPSGGKGLGGDRMLEVLAVRSSVQTEADGSFELGPVRPGELTLVAKAADGKRGELELDVPAAGVSDAVITLEDRAKVSGRVIDQDGKPVTDAIVALKRITAGSQTTMIVNGRDVTAEQAPTHEDGSFEIVGLSAGDYTMSVKGPGGDRLAWANPADKDRPSAPKPFKVEARRHHSGVTLRVEARNHSIRGVVFGPDGKPARDVWVSATRLSEGPRSGGAPVPMPKRPPPGANDSKGGAKRSVAVMTMVMDSDDNHGPGGIGLGMGGGIRPVLTNEDGEFTISKLRKGSYNLMAEGLRGTARGFVNKVKTGSRATIKLISLTKIEGVVRQNGKPVTSFKVELTGAARRSKWVHEAAGHFTIFRVDPGKYKLEVTADAGSAKTDVTVEAGKPTKVDVDLQALVRVSGRLVDPNGAPVAGAKVLVGNASGGHGVQVEMVDGESPAVTGPDGRFELQLGKGGKVLLVMGEDKPQPRLVHPFSVGGGDNVELGDLKTRW